MNKKGLNIVNSKGMLLASETLKMVIAVICIGFLVYFLAALYFSNAEGQEKKIAIDLGDRIVDVMGSLDNLNNSEVILTDLTPDGWIIFSFTEEDEVVPNACVGKSCICICDEVLVDFFNRQISECDDSGVCNVVDGLMELPDIEIGVDGEFTSIKVFMEGTFVGVERV